MGADTKTVDVQAVQYLEELAGDYAHLPRTQADILAKAAGIAELIEAARALDAKSMQRTKLTASVYTSHVMRLRAALRACGGAA